MSGGGGGGGGGWSGPAPAPFPPDGTRVRWNVSARLRRLVEVLAVDPAPGPRLDARGGPLEDLSVGPALHESAQTTGTAEVPEGVSPVQRPYRAVPASRPG